MVGYQCPVTGAYTDVAPPPPPPPFQQTCSEVGEERDEFSPRRQSPPEGRHVVSSKNYQHYIYTNLNIRVNCGSAEQPQLGPIEGALKNCSKETPNWNALEAARGPDNMGFNLM